MKRFFLMSMLVAATAVSRADDYPYFTFERADGTGISLTAIGLELSFAGGNLVATNATTGESTTITLADMAKMYFATADIATSVSTTQTDIAVRVRGGRLYVSGYEGASVVVSNMAGVVLSETTLTSEAPTLVGGQLARGIYIIKVNETTTKIAVK